MTHWDLWSWVPDVQRTQPGRSLSPRGALPALSSELMSGGRRRQGYSMEGLQGLLDQGFEPILQVRRATEYDRGQEDQSWAELPETPQLCRGECSGEETKNSSVRRPGESYGFSQEEIVPLQTDTRQGARDWTCISEVIPKCLCNLGDTMDSKWSFEKTSIYYCLQTFDRSGCASFLEVSLFIFTPYYFLKIQESTSCVEIYLPRMDRALGLSIQLTGLRDKNTHLSASQSLTARAQYI